jgi:adenylate cyclase
MEYKIEYILKDEVKDFNLNQDEVLVGKLPKNDFRLDDNSVSRHHCKFVKSKNGYKIVDLGSTNGTFVNAKKIKEKTLKDGDNITVGRSILKFLAVPKKDNFEQENEQKISMVIPLSDKYIVEKEKELEIARLDILTSLTMLGKALITSTSLEESFDKVGDLIFEFLNPKRLFIFFYDENQEELDLKYSRTRKGRLEKEKVNISQTIAMKAINEKVAILSSNTRDDSRFDGAQSIIIYGITSAISVPIWTKKSIYGLLYIDTTEFDQIFKENDLEVLSIIANFTGLTIEGIINLDKLDREKKLRAKLERYHSPSIVSRIMESQETSTQEVMAYKETEASVLFMDIVGFTPRAESMNALQIGAFLNSFFTEMTDIIFQYQGTLDKFIGDCIMAVFGAPFEIKNHAELSISAALEMVEKVRERNADLADKDQINIRIGINSGKMVAGDFGSPKRLDYTVIGNTVNIASRLESYVAGTDEVVVSGATYKMTKNLFKFESLGEKALQGLSIPVNAYKVLEKKEAK